MKATEIRLSGQLASGEFVPWIDHRARLLDLKGWVRREGPNAVTIVVAGPQPLVDAMEMACSLGPVSVDVKRIETSARDLDAPPESFANL